MREYFNIMFLPEINFSVNHVSRLSREVHMKLGTERSSDASVGTEISFNWSGMNIHRAIERWRMERWHDERWSDGAVMGFPFDASATRLCQLQKYAKRQWSYLLQF